MKKLIILFVLLVGCSKKYTCPTYSNYEILHNQRIPGNQIVSVEPGDRRGVAGSSYTTAAQKRAPQHEGDLLLIRADAPQQLLVAFRERRPADKRDR